MKRLIKRLWNWINARADRAGKLMPVFINICITLYVAANLIFTAYRFGFHERPWMVYTYFISMESASAGCLVWFMLFISVKPYRVQILPVFLYSIFIFIWDIISFITGIGVNHPIVTGIFFGLGALIVAYFAYLDIKKKAKSLSG